MIPVGILDKLGFGRDVPRFQPVRAMLPPDDWFVLPGHFRFGYPWPWQRGTGTGILADSSGNETDREVLGAVEAPRVNGLARFVLWRAEGLFDPVLPTVADQAGQLYGGPCRAERLVRIGRTRAVIVTVDTPQRERIHRMVAEWGRDLLHGEMRTPVVVADGYAPHFDTMLASWSWA
jgi:hypothetical protein